jgi:alkylated DNA repair protein (DNA oxidative demethylase)
MERENLGAEAPAAGGALDLNGATVLKGALDPTAQAALLAAVRGVVAAAPLLRPVTRWGRPMSVRMTSAGRVGWVIDRGRYRYAARHPVTDAPWPPIPQPALDVWRRHYADARIMPM